MKNLAIWCLLSAFLILCALQAQARPSSSEPGTEWTIAPAPGLDALLIIGIVSGDELQQRAYANDLAALRALFSAETLTAVEALGAQVRKMGLLLGPALVLVGSGGDVSSLDAMIESFENPEQLRDSLQRSPYWDEERWVAFQAASPAILGALGDLREGGFERWYAESVLPKIDGGIRELSEATRGVDVIAEQERLLGRQLEPEIGVFLVEYSKPYGIKIQGQRFLNWWGYDPTITLRTAAHEVFHPPLDFDDDDVKTMMKTLGQDPLIGAILEKHDPKYGYNSLEGIVNEDSAQALDQLVSERLGFARDPATRWRESDGGMHLLASAIYDAMIETGFAESGGEFQDWLIETVDDGKLTGRELQSRVKDVVGSEALIAWLPSAKLSDDDDRSAVSSGSRHPE